MSQRRPLVLILVLAAWASLAISSQAAGTLPVLPEPAFFPEGGVFPPSAISQVMATAPEKPRENTAIAGPSSLWHAEPGFQARGINGALRDAKVFDDGSGPALYVGGEFSAADTVAATRVAKWTTSGWSSVGIGPNSTVWSLAIYDDGNGPALYAGGQFTTAGGVPATGIAKWDGTAWSPLGSGVDGAVVTMDIFDDGNGPALYAAGFFSTAGGMPASNIARWNGSQWSSLGSGVDSTVLSIHTWNDGQGAKLYVSGYFTNAGGATANRVASWNGSSWQSLGGGMDAVVAEVVGFDGVGGSALYAVGDFANADGVPASRIAKWNGSAWTSLGSGLNGYSSGLEVWNDGSGAALYIGGGFTTAGGIMADAVAKWDGSSFSPVGSGNGVTGRTTTFVFSFEAFDDGNGEKLFALGSFDNIDNSGSLNIAAWDGASWSGVSAGTGHGTNTWVASWGIADDGSGPALFMGGDFTGLDGKHIPRIAKWIGSGWQDVGGGVDGRVNVITTFDDGTGPALYAGGYFKTAGGLPVGQLARWDGQSWSMLGTGIQQYRVFALAVFDDGGGPALYAGGEFTFAGGVPALNVAKWNGTEWSALGEGLNSWVLSLEVFDDGNGPALYAGGYFEIEPGGPGFAKWDGAHWVRVPGGPNGSVLSMGKADLGSGTVLIASGGFTQADGEPADGMALWDGISWTPIGVGFGVSGFGTFAEGDGLHLYGVGYFADTPPGRQELGKWDGSQWVRQGVDFTETLVARLQAYDDGGGPALFVGGTFTIADGLVSSYLAKLRPAPLIRVPPSTTVVAGNSVEIPVMLDPAGNGLSGTAFSLDYDQHCLDPDVDHNGVLDQITFSTPGFSTSASFNPLDTDGEIDISIFDFNPPIAALPSGEVARILFQVICPVGVLPVDAPIRFSTAPRPSFGDLKGTNVEGNSANGVVHILGGSRGDCNHDGLVGVADLTAVGLEIFDGGWRILARCTHIHFRRKPGRL